MFQRHTQNNEKALLGGSHYGAWNLLTLPRHSGRVFGPESRHLAAGLDSGQNLSPQASDGEARRNDGKGLMQESIERPIFRAEAAENAEN
jgi:hypothetical protein